VVGALLVHGWTTNIHGLTRLTIAWTWRKPSPSPLHPNQTLFYVNHGGYIQISFCPKTPYLKFFKLGNLALWRAVTYFQNFWLKWCQKQSCNLCRDLSNDMWHATCTHIFKSDSWLLVGGVKLTLWFSTLFLVITYILSSNESCEPILDIYVSRFFQLYKEHFNPISFDP